MPFHSAQQTSGETAPAGLVSVDGRTFPLREVGLRARAEGGIAAGTLVQVYENPYQEPLEVLYTMPLPADGSVIGYTIRLGERRIAGEIERRETARERYRRALEMGHTAGLLEQERADTFTQTLGNLPPGETARVEIEILQPLAFLPGAGESPAEWEYRFPTVVAVRYRGGPGRVPDADRLDSSRAGAGGTPVRLDLDLLIADEGGNDLAPVAPHGELEGVRNGEGLRVAFREGARLDRDVVVRWRATGREVGVALREGRGLENGGRRDDGRYGILTITPPSAPRHTFARDLTILIDASGSMIGEPIRRAKRVAGTLIRSLGPRDRFELLAFSLNVERLIEGPLPATPENVRSALGRLERLQANGGTEMARAMIEALRPLREDSQRQVVLLTDGYVGFEHEVVGETLHRLPDGARLHAVGIGSAPNRTLTRYAARAGRGIELGAGSDREAEAAAERLVAATAGPVLVDLKIEGEALEGIAPARSGDVFSGRPLVAAVELAPAGGEVRVTGRLAGSDTVWMQRLEVAPRPDPSGTGTGTGTLPLGALYGREAIDDREMHLAAAGQEEEGEPIEEEIEALGLRHRITSRRTSLVAVSEDPTVDPRDPRRRKRLETELPAGVSAEGVGLTRVSRARKVVMSDPNILFRLKDPVDSSDFLHGFLTIAPKMVEEGSLFKLIDPAIPPLARVIRLAGNRLVLEFETPGDRFLLPGPGDAIEIRWEGGRTLRVTLREDDSTRPGPHAAGLTVRLVLQIPRQEGWPAGRATLSWTTAEGESRQVSAELPRRTGARM